MPAFIIRDGILWRALKESNLLCCLCDFSMFFFFEHIRWHPSIELLARMGDDGSFLFSNPPPKKPFCSLSIQNFFLLIKTDFSAPYSK